MQDITTTQNANIVSQETISKGLFERYLAYLDTTQKTEETYKKALKNFAFYLASKGINKPTRETILEYKKECESKLKPTTTNLYIIAVRLFFKWASQEGLYPNIADHIKGEKVSKEHKKDYLTTSMCKELLESIDTTTLKGKRDYAMLCVMLTMGTRTIEVARADIGDIRTIGNDRVLFIQGKGRTEKAEYIKMPNETSKAISNYLKARGTNESTMPLFTSDSNRNNDERLTTRSISRIAKEHLKQIGYDSERLTAHSFRHTAVTLSLLGGRTLEETQQFARHSNLNTTLIYSHALDKAQNKCAETIGSLIFG